MGFFFPMLWGSVWRPFGPPEIHYNDIITCLISRGHNKIAMKVFKFALNWGLCKYLWSVWFNSFLQFGNFHIYKTHDFINVSLKRDDPISFTFAPLYDTCTQRIQNDGTIFTPMNMISSHYKIQLFSSEYNHRLIFVYILWRQVT